MCFLVDGVLTLPSGTFSLTSPLVLRFIGDRLPCPRLSSMIMALCESTRLSDEVYFFSSFIASFEVESS